MTRLFTPAPPPREKTQQGVASWMNRELQRISDQLRKISQTRFLVGAWPDDLVAVPAWTYHAIGLVQQENADRSVEAGWLRVTAELDLIGSNANAWVAIGWTLGSNDQASAVQQLFSFEVGNRETPLTVVRPVQTDGSGTRFWLQGANVTVKRSAFVIEPMTVLG